MGISQSLYTGVTGLSANSDGMSVIANNIANANAKGYKKDRIEFEDLLSLDMHSGSGRAQIGHGTKVRAVRTLHSQGSLKDTTNLTDFAILGSGFFITNDTKSTATGSTRHLYSRVGSMHFDNEGYLADANGGRVQGYMANPKGILSSKLTNIRIAKNTIPPKTTDKITMNINLDARSKTLSEAFNLNKAEETSNFNTSISIFDNHGRTHQATIYFRRIDNNEGISWEWHSTIGAEEVSNPSNDKLKEIGHGLVHFDMFGNLVQEKTLMSSVSFADGARANQVIEYDFGKNIREEGGDGINSSTSISANSLTSFHMQDGYESGHVKSLNVDLNGIITGIYTNGLRRHLCGLGIAVFENEVALQKAGQNQFHETINSGPPNIGLGQMGTRGSIYSATLEEANVDLANEFVDMIMTQRLFQANSRAITTSDKMIGEVINLKRS